MSALNELDHITWLTLIGEHAQFASGTASARRYASGFSPILGFADVHHPDFAALEPYCEGPEHFYCDGWTGPVPAGWKLDAESTMYKMVWSGDAGTLDPVPEAIRLQPEHAAQALALAQRTRPGPFGPRTTELGEYFGVFEDGRLLAMAGERMCTGQWREISGVCTEPELQGRGLARRLMLKLIQRQVARGERPFLHVMHDNSHAHALYQRMGFVDYRESVVRVISRT